MLAEMGCDVRRKICHVHLLGEDGPYARQDIIASKGVATSGEAAPDPRQGVISLKGPAAFRERRNGRRDPVASPSASDLKTMRLEQIKQRARAKRPAVAAPVVEAPEVVMVAPAIEAEVSPVVEAPAVMTTSS
jgi:hypothetical protein